jgi:hypothetical protein
MRFEHVESMSKADASFPAVGVDEGGNKASNAFALQNIKVRIDREKSQA